MISNKHRKWFHSSLEKLPLVRMSASWFLVSTYLIWILWSMLILSNNQSSATLWVLDFCPLWSIWSQPLCLQKRNNWASNWEGFALVKTWSTLDNSSTSRLPCLFVLVLVLVLWISPRARPLGTWSSTFFFSTVIYTILLSPHPIDREQEHHPFANQHPKKWIPILWNCETLTFASCTSNLWEQMFDFRKYIKIPTEVDLESSRSPAKSESWNKRNR